MATLADSLLSSTGRKLLLRKRPDLSAARHHYQGRSYWIVKDPVGLNYFRFQDEEYAILDMLDGRRSLDEMKKEFEARFPPQKIRLEELGQYVGTLHRSGLILSESPGQGTQLKKRRDERKRQEVLGRFQNILSMRFKGINPDRLLNWLDPLFSWMFTPWAVAAWFLLALSALTLVTVQFDTFQKKLPSFHEFFTVGNAFWLMVVLALTKVIHEFGHGLSCKHFGGECHEMGFMLLVMTPCLYCNVSDSWMLPNKWHRAIIGAGGMYIEVLIASICTFIWWFTEPGLLHNLALSTMFVSSVSTVLFNGNPLMRYDGYYILSDLLEIPNLSQKANSLLSRLAGQICLGLEMEDDPFLPKRHQALFALYAVAAAAYRWVVVFGILFFLNEFFKPYRLQIIGQMLGAMSLYGLFIHPLWKLGKWFYVPGRTDLVKKKRMWATVTVAAVLVAAVLFVPVPHRVFGTLEIEADNAANVYVEVPGQLQKVNVRPGDRVEEHTLLAMLDNVDVQLAIAELEGKAALYESQLAGLRQRRFEDETAGMQIPEVAKSLSAVTDQLTQKRHDLERLQLVATRAGTVLPPPETPPQKGANDSLPTWSGSPFDRQTLGAMLPQSTLFCQIGDPKRMRALVVIDQADTGFLHVDPARNEYPLVDIVLDALPGKTFRTTIREVSKSDIKVSPRHLSNKAGGELATKTDASGVERPLATSYQARTAELDDPDGLLRLGLRGRAKVYAPWEPLGKKLWRWFSQTFHFKL